MYRPGKPAYGPPPFGPPPPHGPPFTARGRCGVPPPGLFVPGPCGPFVASGPNSQFLHDRPPGRHFTSPHCSSVSIDHNTPNALGSSQRMVCPAEPPFPQWNPTPVEHRRPDNSDQAGEEFLRCIADNKPLPDHLKGNMAYNLADAIRTANALKEAVKSDLEFQHMTKRKSHSRSRSHGRSRGKSCAKSPVRSKSRARSRSRGRHQSRTRGRSRAKSKSRPRSRSPSQSRKKSYGRSKSQVRRSRSQTSSSERSPAQLKKRKRSSSQHRSIDVSNDNNLPRSSLLEGLKMVMNSRELEERLPSLKEALLTIQGSSESKKVACALDQSRHKQPDSQDSLTSLENDSVLLPHDRVGSDFSWLQANRQENVPIQKADALEDEESFLYGSDNTGQNEANKCPATLFPAFTKIGQHAQQHDVSAIFSQQHYNSKAGFDQNVHELKQPPQATSSGLANLDSSEYEKIKEILKSVGTSDISEAIVKMQGQAPVHFGSVPATTVPSLSNPNVRQALESLQCLIKATKGRQAKNDVRGSSQTSDKHKEGDEERKQRKQGIICEMESLLKELDGLLKEDELGFLTPVLGLYCQKCEEFFGDLNCAESHAAIHRNNTSNNNVDKQAGDSKGHSHYISSRNQQPHLADMRDHNACSYPTHSGNHRNNTEDEQDRRNEMDHRSIHSGDLSSHSATQESIRLRKERMLITVSRGLTPLNVRAKDEENKEAAGSHGRAKVEDKVVKEKSSKDSTDKARKDRRGSSNSSDSDTGKAPKAKSPKKKKKKKKKKRDNS